MFNFNHQTRKPDKSEEDEPTSPCPNCKYELPKSELDCPSCKNSIPYCVVTGHHMSLDDWTSCSSCHFPATFSFFKQFIAAEKVCPMCEQAISPAQIVKEENPLPILKKFLETQSSDWCNNKYFPRILEGFTYFAGFSNQFF